VGAEGTVAKTDFQCVGQNHKKAALCTNMFKQYLWNIMHLRVEAKNKEL